MAKSLHYKHYLTEKKRNKIPYYVEMAGKTVKQLIVFKGEMNYLNSFKVKKSITFKVTLK